MKEERTPFNEQVRDDINNFRKNVQSELNFLLDKYEPKDVNVYFEGNRSSGMKPIIEIKLTF